MTGHKYGPHRPEDAPQTVEVYPPGPWTDPIDVPIHPAVLRQRERINNLAHESAVQGLRDVKATEEAVGT